MFLILLSIFLLLLIVVAINSNKKINNLKNRQIKHIKPLPFLGNLWQIISGKESTADFISRIYNSFPNERVVGLYQFTNPVLVIKDVDLIKELAIKHFDHFADHVGYTQTDFDPLWTRNLFASKGERWHNLRATMSPVFTSSKMRAMFVLMNECAQRFIKYFNDQNQNLIKVEMKDISARFANDVIASAAFGINCDSLANKNHEFLQAGRELTDFSGKNKFKFLVNTTYPMIARLLKLQIINDRVGNFFRELINETLKVRQEKKIVRPDLIHLLMMAREGKLKYEELMGSIDAGFAITKEYKNEKSSDKVLFLSDEDITAQALVFFFGGFDTVSTGTAFVSYELAINTNVQEKLRDEIRQTHQQCDGVITYEKLAEMKYMDMVITESLRKWTQAFWLDRQCTKDFTIKAENSGEVDIHIKKGDSIWLPAWPIHHDAKYYPDPEKFDPERFSDANKGNIKSSTYLPFGVGPRNCIGSRFALLEIKVFLYYMLMEYELVPIEKTSIPVEIEKGNFILSAKGGIHLGLKKLTK